MKSSVEARMVERKWMRSNSLLHDIYGISSIGGKNLRREES